MMTTPESTSAEAFNQYVPGRLIAASNGWKNLLVRIYSEPRVEESVIYPAVAEPRIVRILSGGEKQERARGSWSFSSIYNESEYFDDMAMDTTTYAAVAALSKSVVFP